MNAETVKKAIKAGMGYTGHTQNELAHKMGISEDTLRRKLRRPESLTLGDLIAADKAVRWTAFAKEAKWKQ